jgi:outer membrane murein-binding lipoprotein Lpp
MKKIFLLFSVIVLGGLLMNVCPARAADTLVSSGAGLKEELKTDRQQIKEELEESKDNAQEAKTEENQLKEQIKAAVASGDLESARKLREQLRLKHQENMQERVQDKEDIQEAGQELKSDIKEARQSGYLEPKLDKDNNPPGPKGGPGTNWENPPGPKGGPGASPDRRGNR